MKEKELEKWKIRVKELESENFIKDQTIKQLREESEVRIMKSGSRERRLPLRLKFLSPTFFHFKNPRPGRSHCRLDTWGFNFHFTSKLQN